eukprot:4853289-Pleurochrysis_carterae.AAC.3
MKGMFVEHCRIGELRGVVAVFLSLHENVWCNVRPSSEICGPPPGHNSGWSNKNCGEGLAATAMSAAKSRAIPTIIRVARQHVLVAGVCRALMMSL